MATITEALRHADAALVAAQRAPLSRRKAMLAALLLDAAVDTLFEASEDDDILAFRADLASRSGDLRLLLELCAMREGGPRLVIEAVEVPISDYGSLDVQDFMISLYNAHTVQRVRIVLPDSSRHDTHAVLAAARNAIVAASTVRI